MRTAIKNTNAVLNLAISPGVTLIPSEMLILKEPVPGYDNVLTLVKHIVFGENGKVNYYKPVSPKKPPDTPPKTPDAPKTLKTSKDFKGYANKPTKEELMVIFGSVLVFGAIIAKFLFL